MHVHILIADKGGSEFWRVTEPIRAVQAACPDITITTGHSVDVDAVKYHKTGLTEISELRFEDDVDVLVIQRPLRQTMAETARFARTMGIAVVIELDDDFWTVSPHNQAARAIDPQWDKLHNIDWLDEALRHAHAATVSTTALLKAHPQAMVCRNYIARGVETIRRPADRPVDVVGWTGTVATHPHDLQVMSGALRGQRLHVVGQPDGVKAATGAAEVTNVGGWIDGTFEFWRAIGQQVDVGIVPLEPTSFNDGKSWIKGLEFAALGIPFVASPVQEYRSLMARGAGIPAKSKSQWMTALRRLTEDDRFYARQRDAGLRVAAELYVEDHAMEWVQAWEKAARLAGRKV